MLNTATIITKSKKLTSKDLFLIKTISSVKISSNKEDIFFTQTTFVPEKNDYESKICLIKYDAHNHNLYDNVQEHILTFTSGPHDSSPQLSPDGSKIAFLRKIGEHAQIFVIPRNGGEARQLTNFKNDVSFISWSPDGTMIAITAYVRGEGLTLDENNKMQDNKTQEDPYKKYNADVKVIQRIKYKLDGQGFLHNKNSQIFIMKVNDHNINDENVYIKVTQLTFGEHDAFSPQFSPDGKHVVFSSNRNPEADYECLRHIFIVPVAGGKPENLTPGEYYLGNPSISPDGKWIACIGTDTPYHWYAYPELWLLSFSGGKPECLTKEIDLPIGNQGIDDLRDYGSISEMPVWSKDNKKIYFSMSRKAVVFLAGIDIATKQIKEITKGKDVIFSWDIAQDESNAAFVKTSPAHPDELYLFNLKSSKITCLTNTNNSFAENHAISTPEEFTVTSQDGTKVEGWILKPPDFEEGKKYPAILEIHGGPCAMYSRSFFFEFQLLANNGYVVVYSNPRGSMGYGQKFCEAINRDWGNLDYQDLMAIIDGAVAKGYIDDTRLGVAGGSYGGFMTSWIIGHTHRFKAAISMRSLNNWYSCFGVSDYGYLDDYELGCCPWEKPEVYLKKSPLSYVENIHTSLLILHSEEDYRCGIEQAEQLFVALKKLKRDVVFIRFPGESHDLSRSGKPWHRIFRLDQIVEWFNKYLKPSG